MSSSVIPIPFQPNKVKKNLFEVSLPSDIQTLLIPIGYEVARHIFFQFWIRQNISFALVYPVLHPTLFSLPSLFKPHFRMVNIYSNKNFRSEPKIMWDYLLGEHQLSTADPDDPSPGWTFSFCGIQFEKQLSNLL